MTTLRHTTFDAEPQRAALQASENARDAIDALGLRPVLRQVAVELYTATGSTSTRIPLPSTSRPWAVVPVLVAKAYDQGSPVTCRPTLNFLYEATTQSLNVFEPEGLTAGTVYRLQFLVVEALS